MPQTEELPVIFIHKSPTKHCWCIVLGPECSHPVPIRKGLFSEEVAGALVASEVATLVGGAVKVKIV